MEKIINNYYVSNLIYILFIVILAVSIVKKKRNKKIIDKKIDWLYFTKLTSLSFVLRIFVEQIIIYLPIEQATYNLEFSLLVLLVNFITTCVIAPISEEIIFRYGIFNYINKKLSPIISIIITSIIFSIVHLYGVDGFIILLVISIIWNYGYYKTNNLIYPIMMHFVHNVYAFVNNFNISNAYLIIFGLINLFIYIISSIKKSSKNTAKTKNE